MEKEIWKDVIGHEGIYQVSNLGNIKSLKFNKVRILKQKCDSAGYLHVDLCNKSNSKISKVHRLVALAFIDNPDNKPYVNHKNGIKTDNRIKNLEWVTAKENTKHAYDIGLMKCQKGQNNPFSILNENQILKIRQDNRKLKEIAKDYNVCLSLISKIKLKKRWSHI